MKGSQRKLTRSTKSRTLSGCLLVRALSETKHITLVSTTRLGGRSNARSERTERTTNFSWNFLSARRRRPTRARDGASRAARRGRGRVRDSPPRVHHPVVRVQRGRSVRGRVHARRRGASSRARVDSDSIRFDRTRIRPAAPTPLPSSRASLLTRDLPADAIAGVAASRRGQHGEVVLLRREAP